MHLFEGSGESRVHEPHKGTAMSPHKAEPALQDSGLQRQAVAAHPGNPLALAVQGTPWAFP